MAEYSNNALQEIAPNETVIFTESPVPCERGFVRHRDETGNFLLSGYVPVKNGCRATAALYLVMFGANISVPDGETVDTISLAITIDGATIPASTMSVTPAAANDPFSVSTAVNVQIWRGCCETIAVKNISTIPINVSNANIIITRPDMTVTY